MAGGFTHLTGGNNGNKVLGGSVEYFGIAYTTQVKFTNKTANNLSVYHGTYPGPVLGGREFRLLRTNGWSDGAGQEDQHAATSVLAPGESMYHNMIFFIRHAPPTETGYVLEDLTNVFVSKFEFSINGENQIRQVHFQPTVSISWNRGEPPGCVTDLPAIISLDSDLPPPASGKVTLNGRKGAEYRFNFTAGGTGDGPGQSGTILDDPIVWTTANPQMFAGKIFSLWVAGELVRQHEVTADADGSFHYIWTDPAMDEDGDGEPDGDPAESPVQPEEGPGQSPTEGVPPEDAQDIVDGAEARPDRPSGQGSSATDNGEAVSKKDHYWAVRDAVEDALGGPLTSPQVDKALGTGWEDIEGTVNLGDDTAQGASPEGKNAADAVNRLIDKAKEAVTSTGGPPPILPSWGKTATYTLPLGPFGSTTLNTNLFQPALGYIRVVFEYIIYMWGTFRVLGTIRESVT